MARTVTLTTLLYLGATGQWLHLYSVLQHVGLDRRRHLYIGLASTEVPSTMFGLIIDFWKDGTATMAENERHESEDENSIATPLVLPVRE